LWYAFPVNPPKLPRQWSDAVIGATTYHLIAFYYPGGTHYPNGLTDWDRFYRFEEFGNFYVCPQKLKLTAKGITGEFHTAEAAFQATKFWSDPAILARFENAPDGPAAFDVRDDLKKHHIAADDDPVHGYAGLGQTGAMEAVLKLKYAITQFKDILLESGDAYLLEHNTRTGKDWTWSDNFDGTGENRLGQKLMELRKALGGAGVPLGTFAVADFTSRVKTV